MRTARWRISMSYLTTHRKFPSVEYSVERNVFRQQEGYVECPANYRLRWHVLSIRRMLSACRETKTNHSVMSAVPYVYFVFLEQRPSPMGM